MHGVGGIERPRDVRFQKPGVPEDGGSASNTVTWGVSKYALISREAGYTHHTLWRSDGMAGLECLDVVLKSFGPGTSVCLNIRKSKELAVPHVLGPFRNCPF